MLSSALLLSSSSRAAALSSGGRLRRPQALLHVIATHGLRRPPTLTHPCTASSIWTHAAGQQGRRRLLLTGPPRGGGACGGCASSRRGMTTTGGTSGGSSGGRSSSKPPTSTQAAPPSGESVRGASGGGGADGGRAIKAGVIGAAAGVFGSLVGMGGAFVMIPAMTGVLKFSQHQAHGTSLAAVVATGSGGAISYATAAGAVDWEAAASVAACGMLTARLGAYCTARLSAATLKRLCGAFQIVVAPMVPFRDQIVAFFKGEENDDAPLDEEAELWRRRLSLMGIGLGSGFLAGLFGVGGGAVTVPALTLSLGVSHYQALGTSLAAMVPTAVVGTYTHHTHGNVVWSVVAPLALGSLAGSYFGGKEVALRVPEEYLKYGFGVMMVVLGAKTIAAAGPLRAAASAASGVAGKMK